MTLLAGVHIGEFSVDAADGAATDGVARSTIPLPVVGASAVARFMGNWSANADLRAFLLHADRYSGYQAFARFALLHQTFRRTQLGIGYVFNRVALDSDERDFGARLVSTYRRAEPRRARVVLTQHILAPNGHYKGQLSPTLHLGALPQTTRGARQPVRS